MSIPIVSIVGRSNTGKTTLIEKLLRELVRRGYRAATIKHNAHGFEIDHEGKDSYRHKQAGAALTLISSHSRIAVIKDVERDYDIDEISFSFIEDVDIILTEGFKGNDKPKIEVFRSAAYPDLLSTADDDLIAIATDSRHPLDVPQFGLDDAESLTDIIERRFLKKPEKPLICLSVDGRLVSLKPFIRRMLIGSIRGMIASLKGCRDCRNIDIKIRG
jgi:molybdopterin-guanine dinucleotide biosynthesis protein B